MNICKNILGLILMSLSVAGLMYGAEIERKEAAAFEVVERSEKEQLSPDIALLQACTNGDMQTVKTLIDQRADVNFTVRHYGKVFTPLINVINGISPYSEQHISCLQLLLDMGADTSISRNEKSQPYQSYDCRHIYDYTSYNELYHSPFIFSILDAHQQKLTTIVHNTINFNKASFPSFLATIIAQYVMRHIPKESPLVTAILVDNKELMRKLIAQKDGDKTLVASTDVANGAEKTYENLADFMEHDATFKEADEESNGNLSTFLRTLMAEQAEKSDV